jgi:NADH-quinone oxidoreductase subunit M
MAFAMAGTFLASDGLLYYIFWELSLIPIYFIALIWGNGDVEERKKAVVKFFIYTLAGSLFMLIAFVYLYQQAGSFLLEDLYKLNLSATEQLWIFLAFFLAYAIKIHLFLSILGKQMCTKSACCRYNVAFRIMLKMGLYSIIRGNYLSLHLQQKVHVHLHQFRNCRSYIWFHSCFTPKDLKLLAYSSLAHVGLIAAGTYTLTIDGLRGAVLQMIAHGFVVVGLFFISDIIFRRYETRTIAEMGGIRTQSPRFASMFLLLVLASVALPTTFNFVGVYGLIQPFAN